TVPSWSRSARRARARTAGGGLPARRSCGGSVENGLALGLCPWCDVEDEPELVRLGRRREVLGGSAVVVERQQVSPRPDRLPLQSERDAGEERHHENDDGHGRA